MNLKVIKSEKRLCPCCMEEHEVKTVAAKETVTFKNVKVCYDGEYMYCDLAEELYADEQQMSQNDINMKDSYRRMMGLLTSGEISDIRAEYGISQKDLCILLGWGEKTITRYETHQVQDKAHNSILKKLAEDPEWFLSLLEDAKVNLSSQAYTKYLNTATALYQKDRDFYLQKAIEARYAGFYCNRQFHGNTMLSLDKTVDVIRYFAASAKVTELYKVKLMKLMWYADALSYRERGFAITGLVYKALPIGAVPVEHNSIIDLKAVPCKEIDMGKMTAYYFHLSDSVSFPALTSDDKHIIDAVIERLGAMSKDEMVEFMHNEKAYTETSTGDVIQFKYAKYLQL